VKNRPSIVFGLLAAVVSLAATRPIAMRVEVEPVGPVGEDTAMSITVQVAPEDRVRLGKDFWIQSELTHDGQRVDRLARAVDMDENGQASIEVAWPPGEYELRVEVEGTRRGAYGVWISKITVPAMGPGAPPAPISTPEPTAVPVAPPVVAAGTIAAAAPTPIPEPSAVDQSPEAVDDSTAVGAGAAAGAAAAEIVPEPRADEPEPVTAAADPVAEEPEPVAAGRSLVSGRALSAFVWPARTCRSKRSATPPRHP